MQEIKPITNQYANTAVDLSLVVQFWMLNILTINKDVKTLSLNLTICTSNISNVYVRDNQRLAVH